MTQFILIIVLFLAICITILLNSRKKTKASISIEAKKNQILFEYETKLKEILHNTDEDKKVLAKTEFLKQMNKELALNIYFDKEEITNILQDFAKYEG